MSVIENNVPYSQSVNAMASNSLWNFESLINIFWHANMTKWQRNYILSITMWCKHKAQSTPGPTVSLKPICKQPGEKCFVIFNWSCIYMSEMVFCKSLLVSPADVGISLEGLSRVVIMQVCTALWNTLNYLRHSGLVKVTLEVFSEL